jgi:ribosomal protein S18 acetylase RimI-like enzyme
MMAIGKADSSQQVPAVYFQSTIFNPQSAIFTIRPIVPADTPALLELTRDTGMFKPTEIQALAEVLQDYHSTNQALGDRAVCGELNGQVVGFVYYAPAAMTDRTWHLWWIVVGRSFQGKGIGGDLLRHAEDDMRQSQGRVAFIETSSLPRYEPTLQFYRKHGYSVAGVLGDYYSEGDDMVVFRKQLNG